MKDPSPTEIIRQLYENTKGILSADAGTAAEDLAAMAHRQKMLTDALDGILSGPETVSTAELTALRELVGQAAEKVKTEMGQNRSSMQAAGTKRKVLNAYGTVTVSGSQAE